MESKLKISNCKFSRKSLCVCIIYVLQGSKIGLFAIRTISLGIIQLHVSFCIGNKNALSHRHFLCLFSIWIKDKRCSRGMFNIIFIFYFCHILNIIPADSIADELVKFLQYFRCGKMEKITFLLLKKEIRRQKESLGNVRQCEFGIFPTNVHRWRDYIWCCRCYEKQITFEIPRAFFYYSCTIFYINTTFLDDAAEDEDDDRASPGIENEGINKSPEKSFICTFT